MKNTIFLFAMLVWCATAFAQTRQTVPVESFTKIAFATSGKAYVRQGNTYKVELEGNREVLDKMEAVVEGDKLIIRQKEKWFNWNWSDTDRITAYITTKNIDGLSVSGSGDMVVETRVKTNALTLSVSGSGSLKVEADAGTTKARVSGSGDLIVRGNLASFEGNVSGSGKIELQASVSGTAAFDISGSGKILASGKSNTVETEISGSGKVLAADLETRSCRVRISGSGSVEINVTDELDAKISGSGDVRYRGNPARVNAHSSGSGSVKKLNL
jgi:lipopolysaccharide export system protein LptA